MCANTGATVRSLQRRPMSWPRRQTHAHNEAVGNHAFCGDSVRSHGDTVSCKSLYCMETPMPLGYWHPHLTPYTQCLEVNGNQFFSQEEAEGNWYFWNFWFQHLLLRCRGQWNRTRTSLRPSMFPKSNVQFPRAMSNPKSWQDDNVGHRVSVLRSSVFCTAIQRPQRQAHPVCAIGWADSRPCHCLAVGTQAHGNFIGFIDFD